MDLFSGVDLTLVLQSQPGPFLAIMQIISLFGEVEVYLVLLPAVYWLYDPRLGIRLALITSCTGWFNDILKLFFHLPRPYWVSPDVHMLDPKQSLTFGFPSGHSQIPVSFLGMVGFWLRSARLWILIIILLLVIGLSRIVVGVHFPGDILGGWGIGIAILVLFILLDRPVSNIFRQLSRYQVIGIALIVSLLMACLSEIVLVFGRNFIIPLSWGAFDHQTIFLSNLLSPSTSLITAGIFFGALAGWASARDTIRYLPEGSLRSRGKRYLLGMAGLIFIYGLLGLLIHSRTGDLNNILSWIRGALLGFWISYGAPWLFIRMGMSPVQRTN